MGQSFIPIPLVVPELQKHLVQWVGVYTLLLCSQWVDKNCEIGLLRKLIMGKTGQTSTLSTGSLKTV